MTKFKGTTYLVPSPELAGLISRNVFPIKFLFNKRLYVMTKLDNFGSAKPCMKQEDSGN